MTHAFKPGDAVECIHETDWQNEHQERDLANAKKLGKHYQRAGKGRFYPNHAGPFVGNASAYMHTDEAYIVESITATGGLKLRGFVPQVSPKDVRLSTKPVYR